MRSVVSTSLASRTPCTALTTRPRCSAVSQSTVISRTVPVPPASTVSTATIAPPALVMAAVTLLSVPDSWGSSTRRVRENCALGEAMGGGARSYWAPPLGLGSWS